MIVDALGNPLALRLTGGQVHDITQAEALAAEAQPEALLGDKGYDADAFIESLEVRAIKPVIPPKSNRKVARDCDFALSVLAKVPMGNYVLIGRDAGQTGSALMQQGYHTVLDPLVAKGDVKIVMDQFTPAWKTEPAQANAENALTANGDKVDAFLVSYDGMSLGVL